MSTQDNRIMAAAVSVGGPIKSYKKTILGKVYVSVWNTLENTAEGLILSGDPRRDDETCIIDVFSEIEDFYFKKSNKKHLETGDVIEFVRKNEEKVRTAEEFSDDELKEVIAKPFFSIQKLLNDTQSIALLFRVKSLAQELDKSDKVMKAIEARISEVQAEEFKGLPDKVETQL